MKPRKPNLVTLSAASIWAWLAGMQLKAAFQDKSLLPCLLAVESGLVAGFLVLRRAENGGVPWPRKLLAWLSVALPLGIRVGVTHGYTQGMAVAGLLLTLWGLWTLGRAFGVAPADRGLVTRGPYRFLRHPMYAGALLNALGFVLGNLSLWNLAIVGLMLGSVTLRIAWEEQLIGGYAHYRSRVRWRLLPGIW